MKKIGFIDYYLDEWHANNYPEYIKKQSNGRYEVCCAYGKIDSPIGGMTNKEWSEKYNIPIVDSIETVIEQSDVLIVLSPDNPEMHLELTDLPLKSGKLVYIDKTFAPDKETAIKIFENAEKYNTKCFSSSALRFVSEIQKIDTDKIYRLYSEGPGTCEMYSIHQIEPIMCLMKTRATRVMALSDSEHPSFVIEFADGRYAQFYQRFDEEETFRITAVDKENRAQIFNINSDYFALFIDAMIKFFDTGIIPVPKEQTIDVIGVREKALQAFEKPYNWIDI